MPNFTYYTTSSSGAVWDDMPDGNVYPQNDMLMQQMYEEYRALQQAKKELEEDKKRYPLFFLKEGIV